MPRAVRSERLSTSDQRRADAIALRILSVLASRHFEGMNHIQRHTPQTPLSAENMTELRVHLPLRDEVVEQLAVEIAARSSAQENGSQTFYVNMISYREASILIGDA